MKVQQTPGKDMVFELYIKSTISRMQILSNLPQLVVQFRNLYLPIISAYHLFELV